MATVLIADHEVDHRELLMLALLRMGFDVVTVPDATAALARLAEGGIDVAVIDVRMAGISGIELCRLIRRAPETAALPILMVSAGLHRHQALTALHAGADDFLGKPFSRAEFTARVEALMRLRTAAAARATAAARAALIAARQAMPPPAAEQKKQVVRHIA
ncbi:response regulator transcription factor [Actinoplanes flavus]|uniref:Response regulator n=1 Tax=Actinoplanes flavus TaxID=2820290 RepID=A0ABS3UYQ7_9ACTN|nr:response regulator [Actinoplanes flavus]MBO3743723.1 response regulator [Actinoplanes flavus]